LSKAAAAERVDRALDMVRLSGVGSRRPAQLSGGQQQRVAVARALVFDPKLILMDEPLGALDKNLRDQMQYEIKHIHENLGVTVVYVTHDQSEALIMSDRIAVFNEGLIQQLATPAVLYEQPQNAFVAQFVGENNRLVGKVATINGKFCSVDLASGSKVEALLVNVAGRGSNTTLSLRPERILLDPPNDSCPNVFDARVEEAIYIGKYMRARLNVCGVNDFILMLPNSVGSRELHRGDFVKIGWRAEDCRALDAPQIER
jgi:putative spermidine/putrescine transport system ATP-binding protein